MDLDVIDFVFIKRIKKKFEGERENVVHVHIIWAMHMITHTHTDRAESISNGY